MRWQVVWSRQSSYDPDMIKLMIQTMTPLNYTINMGLNPRPHRLDYEFDDDFDYDLMMIWSWKRMSIYSTKYMSALYYAYNKKTSVLYLVGREHGSRGSMFRTSCSEHVPNMFRTSRIAISTQKNPYGMPLRPQIWEIRHFQKLFTLLVFEKSNSQNRHIYHFHASKNPDTNNPWESGSMFRTCSEHLVRNNVLCQLSKHTTKQCSVPSDLEIRSD